MNISCRKYPGTSSRRSLIKILQATVALLGAFNCAELTAQSLNNINANSNTRAVYEYLKSVGGATASNNLILGQQAGHGATITRASTNPTYPVSQTWDSFCFNRYVQPENGRAYYRLITSMTIPDYSRVIQVTSTQV
jgi:hypothetical protein